MYELCLEPNLNSKLYIKRKVEMLMCHYNYTLTVKLVHKYK